jgi:hypothetical protein
MQTSFYRWGKTGIVERVAAQQRCRDGMLMD